MTATAIKTITRLSVNLNRVALLRNSRNVGLPDLMHAARMALEGGAQGITVHPRPDARHIRRQDVRDLAALMRQWPGVEFNIEGNPFHGLLDIVAEARPDQCTLVPDDAAAATSDHGWDLSRDATRLQQVMPQLKATGARISLFMDPDPAAMSAARALGADRVELYTEPYARAFAEGNVAAVLGGYVAAAAAARVAGLGVNAGHDLNRDNLPPFLRAIPDVLEVSIGHALVADALEFGLRDTVRLYFEAIRAGHAGPASAMSAATTGSAP